MDYLDLISVREEPDVTEPQTHHHKQNTEEEGETHETVRN